MNGDRVLLTQRKVVSRQVISRRDLDLVAVPVEVVTEQVAEGLMVALKTHVLTEQLAPESFAHTFTTSFPASPWQFFKQNHAASRWLGWYVRRWPVALRPVDHSFTVKIEREFAYPESKLAVPELGRPVLVETPSVENVWRQYS